MSLIPQIAQIGWAAPDGIHLRNLRNQDICVLLFNRRDNARDSSAGTVAIPRLAALARNDALLAALARNDN
jgi:hypothetical protein